MSLHSFTALLNINLRGFQTLYLYRLLAKIPDYFLHHMVLTERKEKHKREHFKESYSNAHQN